MTADTNPTSTALYLDVVLLFETSVGNTAFVNGVNNLICKKMVVWLAVI